jgi:hypothetical protein
MFMGIQSPVSWDLISYAVEDFRDAGDTDSQVISKALRQVEADAAPGAVLEFESGRQYTYDSTSSLGYINDLEIDLNGALLKRADSAVTVATLAAALSTASGVTMTLNSVPSNWEIGDNVAAVLGTTNATLSNVCRITAIDRGANSVTLNAVLAGISGVTELPIGTVIAKSYSCFAGRPSSADSLTLLTPGANKRVRIYGGTIDGNKNNQVSNSWRFSSEIVLHSEGGAIFDNKFINTTAECIVGHGVNVFRNIFLDLSGSALHTSVNDLLVSVATPTFFTHNVVRRTNLAGQTASGHAEGAITFSWGPGHTVIAQNLFDGGSEAVFGNFGASNTANPSMLLIVTGNICKNYTKIFASVNANTYGVNVTANDFHNCGDNTALSTTLGAPANVVASNAISGNTVLPNQSLIAASRIGPTQVEIEGGTGPGRTLSAANVLWVRPSNAAGIVDSQHYEASVVIESANNALLQFVSLATKYAGLQFHIAGAANAVGYMVLDNSANAVLVGVNRSGGAVLLKTNNFQDHLTLKSDGGSVFNRRLPVVFGAESTDGSWRIDPSGTDLLIQRRVSGAWVTKLTVTG